MHVPCHLGNNSSLRARASAIRSNRPSPLAVPQRPIVARCASASNRGSLCPSIHPVSTSHRRPFQDRFGQYVTITSQYVTITNMLHTDHYVSISSEVEDPISYTSPVFNIDILAHVFNSQRDWAKIGFLPNISCGKKRCFIAVSLSLSLRLPQELPKDRTHAPCGVAQRKHVPTAANHLSVQPDPKQMLEQLRVVRNGAPITRVVRNGAPIT